MTDKAPFSNRATILTLATIVLVRLLTLGGPDLIDTTEGRYASTAQLMVERNDWVTPWIIFKGVEEPYLGKPPLHFWLMSMSYKIFGLSNFSARLPSVCSSIAVGVALFLLTTSLFGRRSAYVAALVFGSSLISFFLGGACVLDVTLTAGITLAVAGFALAERSRLWGYLCFAGLGIGVLVKGPVAIVFFGMVAGPWVAARWWLNRAWGTQIRALPWITGIGLFLAICIPWYIAAEIRNPGFLKYFIWTENIGRFLSKNYDDHYGSGHVQFRGAAWLWMIPCLVPWSLIVAGTWIERRRTFSLRSTLASIKNDDWLLLGFFWTISCPLLLIFARQYTPTYLSSSIPGFAFLMAGLWRRMAESEPSLIIPSRPVTRWIIAGMALTLIISSMWFYTLAPSVPGLAIPLSVGAMMILLTVLTPKVGDSLSALCLVTVVTAIGYGATTVGASAHLSTHRSTRNILNYAATFVAGDSATIGFANNLPFSARFYSALMLHPKVSVSQVDNDKIADAKEDIIVVRKNKGDTDMVASFPSMERLGDLGRWRVYRRRSAPAGN